MGSETETSSNIEKLMDEFFKSTMMSDIASAMKNRRKQSLSLNSILCAKDNLEASRMLKEMSIALSIYHLQQAVENLVKAFGYIFLDENTVRKSSHNNFELLYKLIEKINSTHAQGMLAVSLNKINELKDIPKDDVARFDDETINNYMLAVTSLTDSVKTIMKSYNMEEMRDKIVSAYTPLFNKAQRSKLNQITPERITSLGNSGMSLFEAFMLGLLTYPHEAYTRYPDGSLLNPMIYKQGNLGIVKCYDFLYGKASDAINYWHAVIKPQ